MITNLVFQGGSVKGLAYIGALRAFEQQHDMRQLKRVAGTSAGAIVATLLALGGNAALLEELLPEFDFKAVLDDKIGGIPTQKKVLASVEKAAEGKSGFFAKIPAKGVKLPIVHRLNQHFGIYEGEYARQWLESTIETRVTALTQGQHIGKHLTFGELHQLTLAHPRIFRDLYVVGVNLTQGKKKVFSHETTPDVIIADAVRISMSIPYVFKPHYVYSKIKGERLVDARRDIWVDGGLFDNYPIRIFDKVQYQTQGQHGEDNFCNPETLGFRLVAKAQKDYFEGLGEAPDTAITSIASFTTALLNSVFAKQEDEHDASAEDKRRTIYIDHLGISPLAFSLTTQQQRALIESGQRSAELYLTGQTTISEPSPQHASGEQTAGISRPQLK